jgi:hypothetical protein
MMSTQQREHLSHRLSNQAAELLLDARPGLVPHSYPLLAGLLAAAAAPGRPVEWSSEQACLIAFRAAQLAAVPGPGRASIVRTAMLRMLTVKAALAALAAAGGGLALAATTGVVDNPFDGIRSPGTSDRPAVHSPTQYPPSPQSGAEPDRSGSAAAGTGAAASDTPALLALCGAYEAGNKAARGKALDSPAFRELVVAAGGKEKVDHFCASQLATPENASPAPDSAPPGREHPTGPPSNPAGEHPTGKPTSHPGR